MKKNAVILLSGGLDSATTLAIASQTYACYALSINYGQRSQAELEGAKAMARQFHVVEHKIISVDFLQQLKHSALTDQTIAIPTQNTQGIPVTYVPARNTIFLSIALAWAEILDAADIFIGANIIDYSGYPDCRPEYIRAYEAMANLATKAGVEGKRLTIHTPLIELSKAEIIQKGTALGVDYSKTVSCYNVSADGKACGKCDSCRFRREGFLQANIPDPTEYN